MSMDANSSRSTLRSEAVDVFKAVTRRITNDNIYICFVENNSVEVGIQAILLIIFLSRWGAKVEKTPDIRQGMNCTPVMITN